MKYRSDIDGLRTVAVLPVLFFHAGFSMFSGGYVGVDIFFVISGFLITKILLTELEEDRFSIIQFYQRRARRILPALFAMIFFSTLCAFFIIPPQLFREYGQSLVSVGAFVSNIFFYLETGYFGFDAEKMPLLHTWSLAVEEQFYIFVPPLLYFLFRYGTLKLGITVLLLSFASLIWSQYLLQENQQGSSFFLIMSRAWELFAGSLVAIYKLDKKPIKLITSQFLSFLGILFIMCSILVYDHHTVFPGLAALLPVIGTFLIISFCRPGTAVFTILSLQPIVWIGLISYSLYLVHQPVFALSRFLFVSEPSALFFSGLILLCFVLAYLSYKYVEQPFRHKGKFDDQFIMVSGAVGCATIIAIGLFIHVLQGLPQRYSNQALQTTIQPSPLRAKCHQEGSTYSNPADACQIAGPQSQSWAVLADSHGVEFSYELGQRLRERQTGLTQYTLSACPPALLHKLRMPGCSDWQNQAVQLIVSNSEINTVVLIFRNSAFLAGKNIKHYPEIPDEDRSFEFEIDGAEYTKEQSYQMYWENVQHLTDTLLNAGKRVVMIEPLPELPLDIRQLIFPKELFSESYHLPLENTTPLSFYNERNKFILSKLATLPENENLFIFSPLPVFCNEYFCSAVKNEKSLYFDKDHPSLYGAGLLADYILQQLP